MKNFLIGLTLLATFITAQEETLDPSIFDGTGKERQEAEAQDPSAGVETPESTSSGTEPEDASGSASSTEPQAPLEAEEATERQEIILPGGAEEEAETEAEAPGIPAASGGSKSRAGETVNSTETIAPGQAVDFPWDM